MLGRRLHSCPHRLLTRSQSRQTHSPFLPQLNCELRATSAICLSMSMPTKLGHPISERTIGSRRIRTASSVIETIAPEVTAAAIAGHELSSNAARSRPRKPSLRIRMTDGDPLPSTASKAWKSASRVQMHRSFARAYSIIAISLCRPRPISCTWTTSHLAARKWIAAVLGSPWSSKSRIKQRQPAELRRPDSGQQTPRLERCLRPQAPDIPS